MSVENSLTKFPFNLTSEDVAWVTRTRAGMSAAQKIRQLFVHMSFGDSLEDSNRFAKLAPGGLHRFMGPDLESSWAATRAFMEQCEIPPFITGDFEGGGNHSSCLTAFTNQLGLAAANDPALSRDVVSAMAKEVAALGFNWTFTPCVDINKNTGSAIVGTRSYGSDEATILQQAVVHMNAMQSHGVACAAKHWPGEGLDWRDQHLVTTHNPLSPREWHSSFGHIYKTLIDGGLLSVMSAHIALPEYMASKNVADGLERYRPASISKHLNFDLLRGELGFNGLILSDATMMAGLGSFASRAAVVPQVIENGCDVFLFSVNEEEDIAHMENGLRSGALSEQRLDDAVTRILGMKAALGLHRKSLDERILPLEQVKQIVGSDEHVALSQRAAEHSVTLVKDTQSLLPLNAAKHRRICWISKGAPGFIPGMPTRHMDELRNTLSSRGFEVTDFDENAPPSPENADVVIYVMAEESSLGKSRIFLDWKHHQPGISNLMQRYWHDVPTLIVSFGHTYYLQDAPRVPTYINAYSTVPDAQRAVADRLTGNAPFTGKSPVDAFAGAPDARF
jgi:beta-N-acetylhexosaminidase